MSETDLEQVLDGDTLMNFFQSEPEIESGEEGDYFGTSTFIHKEDGELRLELSIDIYTPNTTIQVLAGDRALFTSTIVVKNHRTYLSEDKRKLVLETQKNCSLVLEIPKIRVALVENS